MLWLGWGVGGRIGWDKVEYGGILWDLVGYGGIWWDMAGMVGYGRI